MIARSRLPVLAVARVTAVGIAVGGVIAVKEVLASQYLAQHLWRTALWAVSDYTFLGALGGMAAGVFMLESLSAWPAGRGRAAAGDASAGLMTLAAVCAWAVALLAPPRAPEVLGLSHWIFVGAGAAVIWLVAAANSPLPNDALPVWPLIVASGYLVGLAYLWARAWPGWVMAAVASAGLLAALGLCSLPWRGPRNAGNRPRRPRRSFLRAAGRRVPVVLLAGAAVLWIASSAVGFQARTHARRTGRNVLIIAVDTLRYDAVSLLSSHEHEADLTPELRKRLAPHATIFTCAYSQAPWTLPAFSSIFTGLYPEQHGAQYVWSRLEPEQLTLTELLREHGYATQAVISGHYLTREAGVTQGFANYDETPLHGSMDAIAAGVTDRALRFLKTHYNRPFFLFAHYFDPHVPYLPHTRLEGGVRKLYGPANLQAGRPPGGAKASPVARDRLLYDGEVAYADAHIGRLLEFLDAHDLWKNTCVIFVADHGEEFRDHGGLLHDDTLFQELIHVPLAIAAPDLHLPHVVSEPVETRWLFRTVLDVAGIRPPARASDLPSLLVPGAGAGRYARSATCLHGRSDAEGAGKRPVWLTSLENDRYKLIADHARKRTLLFDLRADPGEHHDLSRDLPAVSARLTRALAAQDAELARTEKTGPARRMSEEEVRRLKSLGYL